MRLRHLFKPDEATFSVYGVRCLLCGEREHSLSHISWTRGMWYKGYRRITWNPRVGRWIDRGPSSA